MFTSNVFHIASNYIYMVVIVATGEIKLIII